MSDCLNAWIKNDNVIPLDEDSLRFVPELERLVAEHSMKLKAVYILCSVVEILTSIETDVFPSDVLPDMIGIAMKIFVAANHRLSSVINVEVLEELNNELKTIEAQTTSLAVGLLSAVLANAMNDDALKFHLQEIGKEMNKFCEIYQNVSDASFIDLYKSTYESSAQLLELFSNDLNFDVSATISNDLKSMSSKSNKHNMTKIQEWEISLGNDEEAVKGGVLIKISQALRRKDKNVFSNMDDFEWIWKTALENAVHTDSYVFLASVNVLAELSYWQSDAFLPRLVECFTNWDDSSLSKDVSIMWKCKMGEALAKVFKQIGNFSVIYFDQFSNSLLHLTKSGDELIRSSALSSFADLIIACRGLKYDAMIQEVIFLIFKINNSTKPFLVAITCISIFER
uniref:RNA polymerase II assembly factor Rtp1 C-terminal domain-containing protein n=1 Tax=Panagrolaimus davidi TaxID=227884 RepID=A0A914PZB6_9BILA